MLLTPIEALDLFGYLKKHNLLQPELKRRLHDSIEKNKLSPKYPNEKYLRKTYTCPFFKHQQKGCPFPIDVKPYGCLSFNSHHPEIHDAEFCYSDIDILELRQEIFSTREDDANQEIREKMNLLWEKAPIPNAILDLWSKEYLNT